MTIPLPKVQLLTPAQRYNAYEAIETWYDLDEVQRQALDESPIYPNVMSAAHRGEWLAVKQMLEDIKLGTDR